jgi:hypothetical protein
MTTPFRKLLLLCPCLTTVVVAAAAPEPAIRVAVAQPLAIVGEVKRNTL